MHPMVNIAVAAARAASELIVQYRDRLDTVSIREKRRYDFVTSIDKEAEMAITDIIRKSYPDHRILAEESAEGTVKLNEEPTWIVDPLDGTANYIRGIAHYAVSIGFMDKGRLLHGVVYDPMKQELFTATRGQGAMLDNRRLRVSETSHLKNAIVATEFPFKNRELWDKYFRSVSMLFPEITDIRSLGCAALDLAYVAQGRVDGFWGCGLFPWDMAAGVLLVQESGGYVVDLEGSEGYLEAGTVLASNHKIFKGFLQKIQPSFKNL